MARVALLTQAVEAEVSQVSGLRPADLKTDDGCRRVVRHGHLPERQIMTGIGPVAVRQPRVRDREAGADVPRAIEDAATLEPAGDFVLKGLHSVVPAFDLHTIR